MRTVIDIGATTKQHADIACQLLAAHALTECDTVAFMWGIGKAKAVKVLSSGCKLLKNGNPDMAMDEVVQEATHFVERCYGCESSEKMSSTRYEVWIGKTSKRKVTSIPKLKSLPPTSEAFEQNVKRAHYQVWIWKAALSKKPPDLLPTDFGWEKDEATKSLLPITVPEGAALAPPDVLKVIRCGCATDQPCANASYVLSKMTVSSNVFVVFDKYHKKSMKSSTRAARSARVQHCKEHVITLTTPIPSRDVVLNVAHNKE
ncbi:hypothetical protein GWK47_052177 [Chionoecetes opilio]|uniref:Uncharacterized protein n=1 Tax=Chionoecetes opilio TaxID=41210 RepID=A0A8J5CRX7_CHIOP|nr:hypothetical protein GWK47_052177 [Chionoecetes opilio]